MGYSPFATFQPFAAFSVAADSRSNRFAANVTPATSHQLLFANCRRFGRSPVRGDYCDYSGLRLTLSLHRRHRLGGDGNKNDGASLVGTNFEPALSAPLWRLPSLLGWRHL